MNKGLSDAKTVRFILKRDYQLDFDEQFDIIEKDLKKLEKLEKVFEILKKKRLSIVYFVYEIRADNNERNYSDYKYWAMNKVKSKDDLLTEEEFNLLKEVFGNE